VRAIDLRNACIERVSSRKDHSIGFSVSTPELKPDEAASFLALHGVNVRMMIQPQDTEAEDLVEITTEIDQKTQSQRIRGVLFLCWKSKDEGFADFRSYYENRTEKIINYLKKELDQ